MAGLIILQLNIQNWHKNKYLLQVDLPNNRPDILLINETSTQPNDKVSIPGYNSISNSMGQYTGTAILIKNHLLFEIIPLLDTSILAIKLQTNCGPLIVSTAYVPPRIKTLPTIDLNKLFSYNSPVIFFGDINAHHMFLNNTYKNIPQGNFQGQQLYTIAKRKHLTFIGPDFDTYVTQTKQGRPDIAIVNDQFKLFHYQIKPGNKTGSDHIPAIIKIQTTPIKEILPPRFNYKKTDITAFQQALSNHQFPSLQLEHINKLDEICDTLAKNIIDTAKQHSPIIRIRPIQCYEPTPKIKLKMKQYKTAHISNNTLGYPHITKVNQYKHELLDLILNQNYTNWKEIVQIASDCHGQPEKFWKRIKHLQGNHKETTPILIKKTTNEEDSEDSDYGIEISEYLTNPQDQVELIRETWDNIYKTNTINEENSATTKKVYNWYRNNKDELQHLNIIDYNRLQEDHPILRPVEPEELNKIISKVKDKAPGPDEIRSTIIKILPQNYRKTIIDIFNAILATKYWPTQSKVCKSTYIPKPGKDHKDPLNYRPIALLNIIYKLLEKIISDRIYYFLEYNNFFSSSQFGFRKNKSTQQAIGLVHETVEQNKKQNKATLIITRDVQKAFDTVWFKGLLYKAHNYSKFDLDTTALINNYIKERKITPYFNKATGNTITPRAGVPQGSCLGPILFIIYVNDLPTPIHKDTIHTQFADDNIHVVRSDSTGKNRTRSVVTKTTEELERILAWEKQWKIISNPNKTQILTSGCQKHNIEEHGGININNTNLSITSQVKILGYTLDAGLKSTAHITNKTKRAKANLTRLYRFKSAPLKVKRHLYKAIINPILTYPCIQMNKTHHTNKLKLQRIQNAAVRFITNTSMLQRKTSFNLHTKAKMKPLNIQTHNITKKLLYKLKDSYEQTPEPIYLNSDFYLENTPIWKPKISLLKKVKKNVIGNIDTNFFIDNLPPNPDDYNPPQPLYS